MDIIINQIELNTKQNEKNKQHTACLIAKNLPTKSNISRYPTISSTAFIGYFSSVIGDVRIGENVFIANNVTIRADLGTPFYIGDDCNIGDSSVLHGLENKFVSVDGEDYSIYISNQVSVSHGSIIHGPVKISNNTYVGYGCVLFNCMIGEGCYIDIGAKISGEVNVPPYRYVPMGAIIDTQKKANHLCLVSKHKEKIAKRSIDVNVKLANKYLDFYRI